MNLTTTRDVIAASGATVPAGLKAAIAHEDAVRQFLDIDAPTLPAFTATTKPAELVQALRDYAAAKHLADQRQHLHDLVDRRIVDLGRNAVVAAGAKIFEELRARFDETARDLASHFEPIPADEPRSPVTINPFLKAKPGAALAIDAASETLAVIVGGRLALARCGWGPAAESAAWYTTAPDRQSLIVANQVYATDRFAGLITYGYTLNLRTPEQIEETNRRLAKRPPVDLLARAKPVKATA